MVRDKTFRRFSDRAAIASKSRVSEDGLETHCVDITKVISQECITILNNKIVVGLSFEKAANDILLVGGDEIAGSTPSLHCTTCSMLGWFIYLKHWGL